MALDMGGYRMMQWARHNIGNGSGHGLIEPLSFSWGWGKGRVNTGCENVATGYGNGLEVGQVGYGSGHEP